VAVRVRTSQGVRDGLLRGLLKSLKRAERGALQSAGKNLQALRWAEML
jgi:hypothetical protein